MCHQYTKGGTGGDSCDEHFTIYNIITCSAIARSCSEL